MHLNLIRSRFDFAEGENVQKHGYHSIRHSDCSAQTMLLTSLHGSPDILKRIFFHLFTIRIDVRDHELHDVEIDIINLESLH
jgi:hypothetical protein